MYKVKMICIYKCSECTYYDFDDNNVIERWGKHWCLMLNKEINPDEIDDDCPLDDANF